MLQAMAKKRVQIYIEEDLVEKADQIAALLSNAHPDLGMNRSKVIAKALRKITLEDFS